MWCGACTMWSGLVVQTRDFVSALLTEMDRNVQHKVFVTYQRCHQPSVQPRTSHLHDPCEGTRTPHQTCAAWRIGPPCSRHVTHVQKKLNRRRSLCRLCAFPSAKDRQGGARCARRSFWRAAEHHAVSPPTTPSRFSVVAGGSGGSSEEARWRCCELLKSGSTQAKKLVASVATSRILCSRSCVRRTSNGHVCVNQGCHAGRATAECWHTGGGNSDTSSPLGTPTSRGGATAIVGAGAA